MEKFVKKIESLDNITQWSEVDSVVKETVSQHSFKVAAIANYLLQSIDLINYENTLPQRFKADVLSYAIMHDFDEAIFGRDVSHIVKYNNFNGEHIRNSINEYVDHVMESEFPEINIAVESHVKRFVKLCDWLALLTFVNRNQRMGCKTFEAEDVYCRENILKTMTEVEDILAEKFDVKVGSLFESIKLYAL